MKIKVGIGYDVHRLVEGRELVLGGVKIPYQKGLLGHSDADVLIHAIMDGILGALALGDIGEFFPDTEEEYKGISSLALLELVDKILEKKGFLIGNIDATIVAEKPKISIYKKEMVDNINSVLGIGVDNINIKATTTEGLSFEGMGEGISSHAVVLLYKDM